MADDETAETGDIDATDDTGVVDLRAHSIAITGMHRSGTSMITRCLHDSGLVLLGSVDDSLIDAADDNPEGFWENKAIVACNDDLLEATGGAWDHPPALPPQASDDTRVGHVVDAAVAALDGLREHERWGFKDPRTCLTAGFWMDLEPDLRFIVCVRNPLEVALSLKRRNQNSYSLGLALWERYYATVLDTVPAERLLVTHYDSFFTDAAGELHRLCDFAGLEPAEAHVRSDLRHHQVGVTLDEADVSPSLRSLYAELCRASGLAPPSPTRADEGRVRRLILDGTMAQRHADQRQDAVERLEERIGEAREREAELKRDAAQARREASDLDAKRQARIRELEAQLNGARAEVTGLRELYQETNAALASITGAVAGIDAREKETSRRIDAVVEQIDARARDTEEKLDVLIGHFTPRRWYRIVARRRGSGTETMTRGAKALARRLPTPIQTGLRKGRRVISEQGVVAGARAAARAASRRLPAPTVDAVERGRQVVRDRARAAEPTAADLARRLPEPAQDIARRGRRVLAERGVVGGAEAAARKLARRLPDPIRDRLRRGWRTLSRPGDAAAERGPVPMRSARTAPKQSTPKGPAYRQWKGAYERMIGSAVPAGSSWVMVSPGSPAEARRVRQPVGTAFGGGDADEAADLSLIARLEALRVGGHDRLIVPQGSRAWFRRHAELRVHVTSAYRTVTDRHDAGIVFDLTAPAETVNGTLLAEVTSMTAGLVGTPAVLDWTGAGVSVELPGFTTFRPPAGESLPYLDASVEVVVIDAACDRDDAIRVASLGVITVESDPAGAIAVQSVKLQDPSAELSTPLRTIVWSAGGDEAWRESLRRRIARSDAELILGGGGFPGADDADVIVVVEPGVLPLPGAIDAAAALAASEPDTAVTGKILAGDGRLDAVGGTVFSDNSTGWIGRGSDDVNGPWHEFVRPVCWAPGLLAACASVWKAIDAPLSDAGPASLREWCGAVWESTRSVSYSPSIRAVRVTPPSDAELEVPEPSSWQRVLQLRPDRPRELSDGVWRYLLARDDVNACRL